MRLWRWLSCRTGHHRETVRASTELVPGMLGCYVARTAVDLACLDCPHVRPLYEGVRRTPSRRYALKRTA